MFLTLIFKKNFKTNLTLCIISFIEIHNETFNVTDLEEIIFERTIS